MKKITLFIAFAVFLPALCFAGENFSIAAKYGWFFPSGNLNLESRDIYGISAEYKFTAKWAAEISFMASGRLKTTLEEKGYMHSIGQDAYLPYSGGVNLYSVNLNASYIFYRNSRLESAFKLGIGYTQLSGRIERFERTFDYGAGGVFHFPYKRYKDYETINANLGVSIRFRLTDSIGIEAEALDMIMFNDADFGKLDTPYHNIAITAGLRFIF